jgi:sirohydrochlorin cobaltochelatase
MKQALLVVSFGTSHRDTMEKTISAIEADLAAAFPGWEVRRAFTSGMILRKLRERDGLEIDNVERALARLVVEEFDTVVIQPTHVMNGDEYDKLKAQAAPYAGRFQSFAMGAPLLTDVEDYVAAVSAILSELPPAQGDHALVLMGHGSGHFANAAYAQLEYIFHDLGHRNVFLGTVEGYPELEQVMRRLAEREIRSVTLAPLMVVAGDHAKNDMAGPGEDSWKTQLEAAGYRVDCVVRGLGEFPAIRARFTAHAAQAMERQSGKTAETGRGA